MFDQYPANWRRRFDPIQAGFDQSSQSEAARNPASAAEGQRRSPASDCACLEGKRDPGRVMTEPVFETDLPMVRAAELVAEGLARGNGSGGAVASSWEAELEFDPKRSSLSVMRFTFTTRRGRESIGICNSVGIGRRPYVLRGLRVRAVFPRPAAEIPTLAHRTPVLGGDDGG